MSNPFSAKPDPVSRAGDAPPEPIAGKPRRPGAAEKKPPVAEPAGSMSHHDAGRVPASPGATPRPRPQPLEDQAPTPIPPLEKSAGEPGTAGEVRPVPEAPAREEAPPSRTPEIDAGKADATTGMQGAPAPDAGTASNPGAPVPEPHHPVPPPLEMEEVSCRTCRFFAYKAASRAEAAEGECRCNAPVQGEGTYAAWPTVKWESWCGKWVLGVSDEEMVKMARAVADAINGPGGGFINASKRKPDSGRED